MAQMTAKRSGIWDGAQCGRPNQPIDKRGYRPFKAISHVPGVVCMGVKRMWFVGGPENVTKEENGYGRCVQIIGLGKHVSCRNFKRAILR